MVQYHNLTKFTGNEGYISFLTTMSDLTGQLFGYMLISLIFLIPLLYMINKGMEVNKSIHLSSLYAVILSIIFYISGIIVNAEIIFILATIYIITASIRWYHKE